MSIRRMVGVAMTVIAVMALAVGTVALTVGQFGNGLLMVAAAVGLGWITHPIRYTLDPGYRRRTDRSRWG